MIERICSRLELPKVSEMIHIEDVASQDAITTALRQRQEQGKHVIPVPTFEIKPQFSGYFMAPLRILRGKTTGRARCRSGVSYGRRTVIWGVHHIG